MRSRFLSLALALVPAIAHAQDQKAGGEPKNLPEDAKAEVQRNEDLSTVPEDLDRLVFDTGRIKAKKPEQDKLTIEIHGELQLRGQGQRSFPMDVAASTIDTHPGAISDSLGQNAFFTQW